jgi:predicted aspartyl protease
MKILHIFIGLLLSAGVAFGQTTDVTKEMDIVFSSLKNQDYTLLKPLLDENVKVSELPTGMNDIVLPQVLRQLPAPYKYEITSVSAEGSNTRVSTHFYDEHRTSDHDFLFNADRKLIEMNILKNATASVQRLESSSPENTTFPDKMVIPFKLYLGLILVNAEINGQQGNFLLDSGAPLLILNRSRVVDPGAVTAAHIEAQGVNGKIENVGSLDIERFNWGGLELRRFSTLAMDFSHLEHFGKKIHGIIGYDVFKDYEMTFDYKKQTITLIRTDENGTPVITETTNRKLLGTVAIIEMKQHIAVIHITIGGQEYTMGIDTGASENLLSEKHLETVRPLTSHFRKSKLEGADKIKKTVKFARIRNASAGGVIFKNTRTAFTDEAIHDLNEGYGGLELDGLVGYQFLSQYVTTINYKKKEVLFYQH